MTDRFTRHSGIPGWDQQALAGARVVVVGVGALGNEVSRLLALAGVGDLLICDHDTVEESNLSRCSLFRTADIGRPKVVAVRDALTELGPATTVEARAAPLQSGIGIGELRAADLVISCLDSRAARMHLARRCGLAGVGLLNAGTASWGGEITWYAAGDSCYSCGMTAGQRAEDDPVTGCAAPPPGLPASAPISALIGSWQATAAIRLLCGLPVPRTVTRIDDGFDVHTVDRDGIDPDCRWHEPISPEKIRPTGLSSRATAGELLAKVGPAQDVLTYGMFPSAGGGLARSRVLAQAKPEASLADLGVAPGELLEVTAADHDYYLQIDGYW
ncbi:HesA/MoeB/ThiF family protein [Actinoplanes sp. NPDC004185]